MLLSILNHAYINSKTEHYELLKINNNIFDYHKKIPNM